MTMPARKLQNVTQVKVTEKRVYLSARDAEELLKRNKKNRKVSDFHVLKFATDMEEGRWLYNGEAIKFDYNGDLIDGQHRLMALALQKYDVVIEFLFVEGLPPETQLTMDGGHNRAPDEQLTLSGINVDKSQAAAIRLYITWSSGWLFRDSKVNRAKLTTPKLIEWSGRNPDVIALIKDASKYRGIMCRDGAIFSSYAIIATEHSNMDRVDEFFRRMDDGAGLEQGSAILAARARLFKIKTEKIRVKDSDMLGIFITAFNHWLKQTKLSKFQMPNGGSWTEATFPQVRKR